MPKNAITLQGTAANDFFAEQMVDLYGESARDKCCGPALAAVNRVLKDRQERAQPKG